MSKSFDLITIGGATFDMIVPPQDATVSEQGGEKFLGYPYAKKVYMDQMFVGYGGGAANVAVGAARLGLRVSFMGAVGTKQLSQAIMENFATEKVDTEYVKHDYDHLAGQSIVLTAPDGERTILLYRGANNHLTEADINWPHCTNTKWLYISSLSGESDVLYNQVADTAREHGVKLVINPGATQIRRGPKGLHNALADSSVLILNEEEARELLRQQGKAGETVPEMLETLQAINQETVVITRGDEGSHVCDAENFYLMRAYGKNRINTLGAGDAYGSTLTAALIRGESLATSIRYASINAAAVVADYGAQQALLSWTELTKRAAEAADFQPEVTKR